MTWEGAVVVGLLIAWLAWPRVLASLRRRGRITPTQTTALLIARAPVVTGLGALIFGAPLVVVVVATAAMALGSLVLFPYFRDLLADQASK